MHWADLGDRVASGAQYFCTAVAGLVYPQDCIACGARLTASDGSCLCGVCQSAMPRIGEWQCPRCGDELGPYAAGKHACPSCRPSAPFRFHGATAVCRYENAARQMILKLKYNGDMRAVSQMGRELAEKLQEKEWFQRVDGVVPVPLHWRRRVTRRFNQSELLARALARATGKPLLARALRRTRNTASQATLDHAQRAQNVTGAFRVAQPRRIRDAVILLVDDVMTTCSTAEGCAAALREAGANSVYVAVYAR